MQETGIKSAVIQEICELARKYQIERVVLFGSRAREIINVRAISILPCKAGIYS